MFIKDSNNLPPNIIWFKVDKAKKLLNYFPEISRQLHSKGYTEIAFMDNKELRDKMKELKID